MNVGRSLVGMVILCVSELAVAHDAASFEVLEPVRLYQGAAPGVTEGGCPEVMIGQVPDRVIYNVTVPTYQPFLPSKDRSTGTAVIVAPGGGFELLAIDNEGIEVAKWLAERGIAAFVLKYRVAQTDPNNPPKVGLARQPPQVAPAACAVSLPAAGTIDIVTRGAPGIADGIAAIQQVREHAKQYHIDPKRIVMMGFSASAMVTTGTVLQQDAAGRPDFAAPIYGGPFGSMPAIPTGLPPLFIAVAQNDRLVGAPARSFYEALLANGYHPELHVFNGGSHGFGMHTLGTTSDHWKDSFFWWLESLGLTQKPSDPPRPPTPAFARPLTP